jgi:hypothetical protein
MVLKVQTSPDPLRFGLAEHWQRGSEDRVP